MSEARPIDIEHFRVLLEQRREALLEASENNDESTRTVEVDQQRIGRLSRADALQTQAMAKETARRRTQQLKQVEAALRRLVEGDYGDCLTCGEPIAKQRLEVDPAATQCIRCASAAEDH